MLNRTRGTSNQNNSKENALGTIRGASLGEEHVKWLSSCAKVVYQGRPLPPTQGPKNAQEFFWKTVLGTRPEGAFAPRHVWETPIRVALRWGHLVKPCLPCDQRMLLTKQNSMPNMTGRPGCWTMGMNGGSSESCLARTPRFPLFCALFNRGGNRRAWRLPGEGRDHFHCTVEPSPGHIRCRKTCKKFWISCVSPRT